MYDISVEIKDNPWTLTEDESTSPFLFSYGSNGMKQLAARTGESPGGIPLKAMLPRYSRVFAGYAANWKGGVASVHPSDDHVKGMVVDMSQRQLEILDFYEIGYTRRVLPLKVYVPGIGWKDIRANVYIKDDPLYLHPPSISYLTAIRSMLYDCAAIDNAVDLDICMVEPPGSVEPTGAVKLLGHFNETKTPMLVWKS